MTLTIVCQLSQAESKNIEEDQLLQLEKMLMRGTETIRLQQGTPVAARVLSFEGRELVKF